MLDWKLARCCNRTSFLMILIFCMLFPFRCWAEGSVGAKVNEIKPREISLTISKSTIIETSGMVKRVTLASPDMADIVVLTPQQIYITGKVPGITTLTLWDDNDKITDFFDLEISPEINRLKEKLYEMFPKETNIKVTATHDAVTLSGTVSSTPLLSQVMALSRSYAPKDEDGNPQLINLIEVGGVHQVMVEVRVSEMSRSLAKRFGINFNFVSSTGRQFGVTLLDNLSTFTRDDQGIFETGLSDRINLFFQFMTGGASSQFLIDALKENGLLRILAEPTLLTLSGEPANFLVGGEFPVPIPQSSSVGGAGTVITIEWKRFGVGLVFTPTVLSNGRISMKVAPEVSELDFTNAVNIQGFRIPALDVRRMSTVVELGDGQSFAIAGLIKDDIRETAQKYPILGDVPVLGSLFRSSQFQKSETELIVIVTPHLAKPVDMTKQTLPTDQYFEPNDFEFYLLGKLEGGSKVSPLNGASSPLFKGKEGGLEGDFGYIKPQ